MLFLGLNILLAGIPSLILLMVIYRADTQKKEPKGLVFKVFLVGCLSTIPAILAELLVGKLEILLPPSLYLLFQAFIVAALCEEVIKLAAMGVVVYRRREFDEIMDGVVYTAAASLGFAFFENIVYSIGESNAAGLLLLRGVTAVPLHGLCGGLMGYFIGRSKLEKRGILMIPGLLLAIAIHGLYDYLIFTGSILLALLNIPLLILSFLLLRGLIHRALKEDSQRGYSIMKQER